VESVLADASMMCKAKWGNAERLRIALHDRRDDVADAW
jgi:hypothetical protein